MYLFLVTLRALAPLFLLIVLGYGLKRARVLHAAHVPTLNGLVINVTMPALVVMGLLRSPSLPPKAFALPVALLAAQGTAMLLAWGVGRAARLTAPMRGALMMVGVFGNTGFLGYPITLALHPAQFPEGILLDQFGMSIAQYLSAPLIGAKFGSAGGPNRGERASAWRFLRSPLFLALAFGTLARLTPWPPMLVDAPAAHAAGGVLGKCLGYLGQGTTPLVLLALGASLRPGQALDHAKPLLLASALKLIVCPLAMVLACRALGLHGALREEGLLMAAMPTAVLASLLSAEHDLAGDFAVSAAFGSTVLAAVTVPVLLALLH